MDREEGVGKKDKSGEIGNKEGEEEETIRPCLKLPDEKNVNVYKHKVLYAVPFCVCTHVDRQKIHTLIHLTTDICTPVPTVCIYTYI